MNVPSAPTQPARPARRTAASAALRVLAALAVAAVVVQTGGQAGAQTSQPPERPTGLSAVSVAHDSVSIAWDDPDDSSITGYKILRRNRGTDAPGVFSTIDADTANALTAYLDATVAASTRYVYRVVAVNSAGESERSGYVNVDTPAEPPSSSSPARPAGLEATSVAHDSVSLSWDDPANNTISGYKILRRNRDTDGPGVFTTINTNTGNADTTYIDATAAALTRYVYRVIAVNTAGGSPQSSYVNVDTPAEPENPDDTDTQPDTQEPVATFAIVEEPPEEEPLIAQQQNEQEPETQRPGNCDGDGGEIFITTMTVGSRVVTSGGVTETQVGFRARGPNQFGSLSSRTFSHDSTTYTITALLWNKNTDQLGRELVLRTDPALPSEGIVLSVADSPAVQARTGIGQSLNYSFGRAHTHEVGMDGAGGWNWQPTLEPEFVEGDRIIVRLLTRDCLNRAGLRPGSAPNIRASVENVDLIAVEWEQHLVREYERFLPNGAALPNLSRYRVELIENYVTVKETKSVGAPSQANVTVSTTLAVPAATEDKIYTIFITPMYGRHEGAQSFGFVYVPTG